MSNGGTKSRLTPARQAALDILFADLPGDFAARYDILRELRTAFHETLAAALEPSIKEEAGRRQPARTLRQRQKLATWIDTVTRELGVTTACRGKEAMPVLLIGELQEPFNPQSGTFTLLARGEGHRYYRADESPSLPDIQLIPAPSDIESRFESVRRSYAPGRRR